MLLNPWAKTAVNARLSLCRVFSTTGSTVPVTVFCLPEMSTFQVTRNCLSPILLFPGEDKVTVCGPWDPSVRSAKAVRVSNSLVKTVLNSSTFSWATAAAMVLFWVKAL